MINLHLISKLNTMVSADSINYESEGIRLRIDFNQPY